MEDKLIPDFGVLSFCGEVRKMRGEDCWYYGFCESVGMLAVFDGCGGSGARKRNRFDGLTDAFLASKTAAYVMDEWMQAYGPFSSEETAQSIEKLQQAIQKAFIDLMDGEKDDELIRGFLSFPTTVSAILISQEEEKLLKVTSVNAGDSRGYLLTTAGLFQLSEDDCDQPDPFENLYHEGTINNLINGDKSFVLKQKTYRIPRPCILLCATDGCFDYISTPMEFEGALLGTLMESDCIARWEENLQTLIGSVAGDDHTLCLTSFGFASFEELQKAFRNRYQMLEKEYLNTLWKASEEDITLRRELWKKYRKDYMKYLRGEQYNGVSG